MNKFSEAASILRNLATLTPYGRKVAEQLEICGDFGAPIGFEEAAETLADMIIERHERMQIEQGATLAEQSKLAKYGDQL